VGRLKTRDLVKGGGKRETSSYGTQSIGTSTWLYHYAAQNCLDLSSVAFDNCAFGFAPLITLNLVNTLVLLRFPHF